MLEIKFDERIADREVVATDVKVFATYLTYCDKNFREEHLVFDYLEVDVHLPTRTSIEAGKVLIRPLFSVSIRLHWNNNLERLEVCLSRAF